MKVKNRIVAIIAIVMLVFSTFSTVISAENSTSFKDVSEKHWAKEDIELMVSKGILTGYPDGYFKPNEAVTRAQFAKMMVLTLGLELSSPKTPSFMDVHTNAWEYKYVEAAKYYLTGFRNTATGAVTFKPNEPAVREDMAVAIVKGLGLPVDDNYDILDGYADQDDISKNLRKYVGVAVKEEIMIGEKVDGKMYFSAQEKLSRAEAATLLARLIRDEYIDSEKITFDEEEKVDFTQEKEETYVAPEKTGNGITTRNTKLSVTASGDDLKFKWTPVSDVNFKYYKVVASKGDSTPVYPDNGYYIYISNASTVEASLKAGKGYNGGDIGGSFKAGETYYFSITAVYNDGKTVSNTVRKTVPGTTAIEKPSTGSGNKHPALKSVVKDGGIQLTWSQTPSDAFSYYKVVLSKADSTPKYPENGYVTYISSSSNTSFFVYGGQGYHGGGEFSKLESGQIYYISITACYKDGKYTSNVVKHKMP